MKRFIYLVMAVIFLLGMFPIQPAVGETCSVSIEVTSLANDGADSLRQAIIDVCPDGTITFAAGLSGETITLESQLTLDKSMTIDGSALPSKVTISGNNLYRVFWINSGVTVTLDSLIIANGTADDSGTDSGGGIYNVGGTLTVINSLLFSNYALSAGGGIYLYGGTVSVINSTMLSNSAGNIGGGIMNAGTGTLNVIDSTFSQNSASIGGGVYNDYSTATVYSSTLVGNTAATEPSSSWNHGGGIFNIMGSVTVSNSTFIENSAQGWGNAIFNKGDLSLFNSTLAGNVGYYTLANVESNSMLNFANTIIANTSSGKDCANLNNLTTPTIDLNLNNLIETTDSTTYGTCRPTSGTQLSDDPMLSPLADNGGPTWTMALLPGSPAIDAGDNDTCTGTLVGGVDQRGAPLTLWNVLRYRRV